MTDIFQDLPKTNTKKYAICINLLKDHPLTVEDYAEEYGMMNLPRLANLRSEFDEMVREGLLKRYKGSYSPTLRVKNAIRVDGVEYVKPREPKPFTPMSAKHYLPKVSPRGQQLREFCHIGLSNGAREESTANISIRDEGLPFLQEEQVSRSVQE